MTVVTGDWPWETDLPHKRQQSPCCRVDDPQPWRGGASA
jgi:hypothetical protein